VGLDPKTRDLFSTITREVLAFLLPLRCAGCDAFLSPQSTRRLCSVCLAGLRRIEGPICPVCGIPVHADSTDFALCQRCFNAPPSFGKARSLFSYGRSTDTGPDILGSVIRRHKYGPNRL